MNSNARSIKSIKPYLSIISKELFQTSLVTYLILLLAETVKTGFVSFFFNMNILVGVVLVSGIVMTLTEDETEKKEEVTTIIETIVSIINHNEEKISSKDFNFILMVSLGGALLVYYKTQGLGWLSLATFLSTFTLTILLSYLIYTEDTE